jgi:hypothetical protein
MNAYKLLQQVGYMLHMNGPRDPIKVDPASAKERFNTFVRSLVEGRPTLEMTAEDIHALFDGPSRDDKVPDDLVKALDLRPGSDYANAFFAAHDARKDYIRPAVE